MKWKEAPREWDKKRVVVSSPDPEDPTYVIGRILFFQRSDTRILDEERDHKVVAFGPDWNVDLLIKWKDIRREHSGKYAHVTPPGETSPNKGMIIVPVDGRQPKRLHVNPEVTLYFNPEADVVLL